MKKFILFICVIVLSLVSVGCKNNDEKERNLYEIKVILNEDMTANCRLRFTYKNHIENLDYLLFNLYPNAFMEGGSSPVYLEYYYNAYPNGVSYGGIDITKVIVDGESVDINYLTEYKTHLKVPFENPLKNGEEKTVYIDFKLKIPNLKHRFGYGENTINLTGFYPVLCVYENGEYYINEYYPSGDPFYSNCADYKVSLTLPSTYTVASSLTPLSTNINSSVTKYEYQRDCVRDIAFVLSKDFNVMRDTSGEVKVYYYYFNDENPEKSLNTAVKNISYFSREFIDYPYSEYVVCQADFIYGGMEYPCLSMIDATLKDFDRDYCITHETAHQWWYGIVGDNEVEESYVDEGLTEYSTLMFFDEHSEYGFTKAQLLQRVKTAYLDIRKALAEKGVTSAEMKKSLKEFKSDMEYVSIAYYRSQIMFSDLCESMGDRKFKKFLKEIIKRCKYQTLDTKTLYEIAKNVKRGSDNLLENYINGTAVVR